MERNRLPKPVPVQREVFEDMPMIVVPPEPQTVQMDIQALANQYNILTNLVSENIQLRQYVAKLEEAVKLLQLTQKGEANGETKTE